MNARFRISAYKLTAFVWDVEVCIPVHFCGTARRRRTLITLACVSSCDWPAVPDLDSGDWSGLRPGFWVAGDGQFGSRIEVERSPVCE